MSVNEKPDAAPPNETEVSVHHPPSGVSDRFALAFTHALSLTALTGVGGDSSDIVGGIATFMHALGKHRHPARDRDPPRI